MAGESKNYTSYTRQELWIAMAVLVAMIVISIMISIPIIVHWWDVVIEFWWGNNV